MVMRTRPNQGVVLLVSLGVLLVLSVLAVSFVKLAGQERQASNNYVHHVRAKFAARSGLRMASGRLVDHFRTAVVGTLDKSAAKWVYGDSAATPLSTAKAPSFVKGTTTIQGETVGYSGLAFNPLYDGKWLPPSYDSKVGIQYVLRVTDLNTRINLNDPNPNMAKMLDNLGIGIAFYDSVVDPVKGLGGTIVGTRDGKFGGKFNNVYDLIQAGLSKSAVDVLANYVTVHSWRDTSVIRPKAQSSGTSETYVYDYPKFPDLTVAGRSPININTCPNPVLYAMLRGISATGYLYGSTGAGGGGGKGGGGGGGGTTGDTWSFASRTAVTDAQAKSLTAVIDVRRLSSPIKSHYDLAKMILSSSYPGLLSMVMANLNPNTRFTKFNSDLSYFNHGMGLTKSDMLDKTDLTYWTTEAVFISHGYFQIESLGRIIGKTGHVLARHKIAQIVKVFDVIKHTTQRDFESNRTAHTLTKSYPENLADQGMAASLASRLDGQIALNDVTTLRAGNRWWINHDDTFFGPESHRWYYTDFGKTGTNEPYENLPVDGKQSPATRTILGEDRAASTRTSALASNLHPDGQFMGERIGKRFNMYGVAVPATGKSTREPDVGTQEYWFKPDLRGRDLAGAVKALFFSMMYGKNCPIPASAGTYIEMYWYLLLPGALNGGGWDRTVKLYTGHTIKSTARKSMDTPTHPYKDPYFFYTSPGIKGYSGHVWNHVRLTWSSWVNYEVWLNGKKVAVATATFYPKPPYSISWAETGYFDILEMANFFWLRNGSFYDYRSSGTLDGVRTNLTVLTGIPDRYPTSVGGSKFRGRFKWSSSGLGSFEALSMRFTSYPGFNLASAKSYVGMRADYAAKTTPEVFTARVAADTPAVSLSGSFDPLTGVGYSANFYTGSQAPISATPYFDDVTLFYRTSAGTQVLRRWVVE